MTEREGGGLSVGEFLLHEHEDCNGEWREEKVGKLRVYRCPRCGAVARETKDTRRAYWQQMDARKLRRQSGRRSAIRTLLTAGREADMMFEVALALGELLDDTYRDPDTFRAIRAEYDAMTQADDAD